MRWLLLTHGLFLAWSWWHPRLWVPADVKAFKANGSKDSLLSTFHRQRGMWRFAGMLVPALLASAALGSWHVHLLEQDVPMHLGGGSWLISVLGLLAIAGGYWFWWFNPHLNVARKDKWVGPYHVSWNPQGAWLDRRVWRWAWQRVRRPDELAPPAHEDLRVVAEAGPLYQRVLRRLLVCGIVAYVLSLLILGWWQWPHLQILLK